MRGTVNWDVVDDDVGMTISVLFKIRSGSHYCSICGISEVRWLVLGYSGTAIVVVIEVNFAAHVARGSGEDGSPWRMEWCWGCQDAGVVAGF